MRFYVPNLDPDVAEAHYKQLEDKKKKEGITEKKQKDK